MKRECKQIAYVKVYDIPSKKLLEKADILPDEEYDNITYEMLKDIARCWLQENLSIDELNEFNLLFTFPERDCIHVGDYGVFEIWFNSYESNKKYFFSVRHAFVNVESK